MIILFSIIGIIVLLGIIRIIINPSDNWFMDMLWLDLLIDLFEFIIDCYD